MKRIKRHSGFSLIEVLMAAAILAIGFMLILGTFPVAVGLSARATQSTIASAAANDAFSKVELYGIDFGRFHKDITYNFIYNGSDDNQDLDNFDIGYNNSLEMFYPTYESVDKNDIKYNWSAIGRLVDPNDYMVEVTVFVSHKIAPSTRYHRGKASDSTPASGTEPWPEPIRVAVSIGNRDNILKFVNSSDEDLIIAGSTIVDDRTSRLYRVVDRFEQSGNWYIVLDRNWEYNWCDKDGNWQDASGNPFTFNPRFVWVIPPGIGVNKSPCVGVYQRIFNLPRD